MNIKINKNIIKTTITLMGLFLGLGACYGELPGKVIIDNESTFDLEITATVFVEDGKYYRHHTGQITAANIDKSLQTDGKLNEGDDDEDNIEISVVGSQSTIKIPLDNLGTSKYIINENGNTTELLVDIVDADREYDDNELTGYFYRVVINGGQDFPENDQVINTIYIRNGYIYDANGNILRDRRYGYRYGNGGYGYRYGVGGAIQDVGYGAGSAIQGVGNAIGNFF